MQFIRTLPHRHLNPKIVDALGSAILVGIFVHMFEVFTR